eukprot:TRINITY_DN35911_c0_g1_i1.p1 TRINITY_DN35911_c0_g1~~TRINITY_DN35911_c0_g1_i1.p1  ORF type:complete len:543 (+),score=152.30 TRINITY_DN35911_c0_g1_i1:72-1700(+)
MDNSYASAKDAGLPTGEASPFLPHVLEFYQKYKPEKTRADVVQLLSKYAGFEEDLYQGMEELFNDRPGWPPEVPAMEARISPRRKLKSDGPKPTAAVSDSPPVSPRRQGPERRLLFTDEFPTGAPVTRQEWAEEGRTQEEWDVAPKEELYADPASGSGPLPRKVRVRLARLRSAESQRYGDFACCRCALCGAFLQLLIDPGALQYHELVQEFEALQQECEQLRRAAAASRNDPGRQVDKVTAAVASADAAQARQDSNIAVERLHRAEDEIRRLRASVSSSRKREQEAVEEAERLRHRVLAVSAEMQSRDQKLSSHQSELDSRDRTMQALRDSAQAAEQRVETLRRRLASAHSELDQAREAVNAERSLASQHATAAAAARTELTGTREALRVAADQLKQTHVDCGVLGDELAQERARSSAMPVWDSGPPPAAQPLFFAPPQRPRPRFDAPCVAQAADSLADDRSQDQQEPAVPGTHSSAAQQRTSSAVDPLLQSHIPRRGGRHGPPLQPTLPSGEQPTWDLHNALQRIAPDTLARMRSKQRPS